MTLGKSTTGRYMQLWTRSAVSSPLDLPSDLNAAVYATVSRALTRCMSCYHTPLLSAPNPNTNRAIAFLDQVLAAEVGPQIYDLPYSQCDQHAHSPKREPLHPLVRALIRISQLHLAGPQVVHLVRDFLGRLGQPPELGFHGLQLLPGLDGRPVLGVGADVDVELDATHRAHHGLLCVQDVLEADVKGRVGVRVEGVSVLTHDVAGSVVVIAYGVFDLSRLARQWNLFIILGVREAEVAFSCRWTHVHVQNLAIAFTAAARGRHNNQLILLDKVPYTSLL